MSFPSTGNPDFWACYYKLPEGVRRLARKTYRLWEAEPFHPSLHFKKVRGENWSVRVGIHYAQWASLWTAAFSGIGSALTASMINS